MLQLSPCLVSNFGIVGQYVSVFVLVPLDCVGCFVDHLDRIEDHSGKGGHELNVCREVLGLHFIQLGLDMSHCFSLFDYKFLRF